MPKCRRQRREETRSVWGQIMTSQEKPDEAKTKWQDFFLPAKRKHKTPKQNDKLEDFDKPSVHGSRGWRHAVLLTKRIAFTRGKTPKTTAQK